MPPVAKLLRRPGVAPMVASGIVGRLPMGMLALGLTLMIVAQTGSYALAGAITATSTLSIAIVGPYGARLADHLGQRRAIPMLLSANVAAFLLLTLAVALQWPVALWFLFAAVGGASMPNIGAMTRARWLGIARDGAERSAAFAMESVFDELAFVVGPLIASALALSLFPAAPVLFSILAMVIGGAGLAWQRSTEPAPGRHSGTGRSGGHVIKNAGMPHLLLVMLALGAMFGLLNLAIVAFAAQSDPAWTGVLLAALSFGSLVSGVVLGSLARTWSLTNQVRSAIITLSLGLIPLAFITSPAVFALVAFLAGLSVSTTMIGCFGLVERMVPASRITEGLAFTSSGLSLGLAGGTSVAGLLIDARGPSPALGSAAVCAGAAAAIFWSRSRRIAMIEAAADGAERSARH